MLTDPIDVGSDFSSYCYELEPFIGQTILVKTGRSIALEPITKDRRILTRLTKWAIVNGYSYYICPDRSCPKEEFFSWIQVAYPDSFEWLLFHPEWFYPIGLRR